MSQTTVSSATDQTAATLGTVSFDFGTTASTATLSDQLRGTTGPIDPGHVSMVRKLLIELVKADWPDQARRELFVHQARERLSEKVGDDFEAGIGPDHNTGETQAEQLARWLGEEGPTGERQPWQDRGEPPRTTVLDEVWVAACVFAGQYQPVQDWLNLRLHDIMHRALRQPAFVTNNLLPVPLAGDITFQVDSILVVRNGDIAAAELTDVLPPPGSGALAFRGLKRRVVKPAPLPPSLPPPPGTNGTADSDVLVGQAYKFLGRKVTEFAARELDAPGRELSTAIVTYPTATPPAVRDRLRRIVAGRLGTKVSMRFDEGIAALMFVLMRDFGGDNEAGIETFRARSRMVGAGHWRQNLLVLDIGGGTTDITMTSLDLRNATPGVDKEADRLLPSGLDGAVADDPRVRGRAYFLEPRVLGSTGHPQYGGDLLTLRVFYWIKARLADEVAAAVKGHADEAEVLHGWPTSVGRDRISLSRAIVHYPDPGPGPREVVDYLRDALPTRGLPGPGAAEPYGQQLTPAFLYLWDIALKAKEDLADGANYDLAGDELRELAGKLGGTWKPQLDELDAAGVKIRLTTADFGRLARSVLTPSVELAVDLAKRILVDQPAELRDGAADQPDELLDGIALTGRAAGVPLVKEIMLERLAKEFGERNRGGRPMAWNPAMVTTEHAHPKQAASIGACWAQAQYEHTSKSLAEMAASPQYKAGIDQLIINVDNMVINLPCRFGLGGTTNAPLDLLRHGQPLECSDVTGRRFTRSAWQPAYPNVRLLRFLDQKRFVRWGRYNIEDRLGMQIPPGLRFQIEVDDQLVPLMHLCMGRPLLALDGTELGNGRLPGDCLKSDQTLDSLPWEIHVRTADESTGDESWKRVLKQIPSVTDTTFPHVFVPVSNPSPRVLAEPLPGLISGQLPPPTHALDDKGTSSHYQYVFGAFVPGKPDPAWVTSLPVLAAQRPRDPHDRLLAPYWLTLDAYGRLRLPEPGYPRYVAASDPQMMFAMPGAVLTMPMEPPEPDMLSEWDPFTGEH